MTWARSERERVLVAMSGGVDSSVAAALLREAGHEVVGVTLHLWDATGEQQVGRCCAPEDREDARRTCDLLGVPHYVMDERSAFRRHVVDPFLEENLQGRTPIPCVHCNQQVKLGRLWEIAQALGASRVATGHYARIECAGGEARLLRGRDRDKDQSYFLFGVPQSLLPRLWFPLGDMTKEQARAEGRRLGVPNWNKPDSQELCFVPDGDVPGFVARERPEAGGRPGPILDELGQELGRHPGIEGFTVGQRRGIGVASSAPKYVLSVLPASQALVVGDADRLLRRHLRARNATWLTQVPYSELLSTPQEPSRTSQVPARVPARVSQVPVGRSFEAEVQIRYRHEAAPARVRVADGEFEVEFAEPQRAIAPGQAAVVYRGETVLGGGFIAS